LVHDQALADNPAITIIGPFAPAGRRRGYRRPQGLSVRLCPAPVRWLVSGAARTSPPGGV
jgi:hypothetical protein